MIDSGSHHGGDSVSNHEMKVFLAPERRSKSPWVLALLAMFIIGAAAFYFFAGPAAPAKTGPALVQSSIAPSPPLVHAIAKAESSKPVEAASAPPLIDANFDRDTDGFLYVDDAFRGTQQPDYAEGIRKDLGPPQNGVLQIHLGGKDAKDIRGMSGGWRRSFNVENATPLMLSFRYMLMQSSEYEDDEFSQALVTVDTQQFGSGGKDYIAQFTGDGNGGPSPSTGWQIFSVSLGPLAPGSHVLTIGAYNNKKTATNETTDVRIDNVRVGIQLPGGVPPPTLPTPAPLVAPAPMLKKANPAAGTGQDDTF